MSKIAWFTYVLSLLLVLVFVPMNNASAQQDDDDPFAGIEEFEALIDEFKENAIKDMNGSEPTRVLISNAVNKFLKAELKKSKTVEEYEEDKAAAKSAIQELERGLLNTDPSKRLWSTRLGWHLRRSFDDEMFVDDSKKPAATLSYTKKSGESDVYALDAAIEVDIREFDFKKHLNLTLRGGIDFKLSSSDDADSSIRLRFGTLLIRDAPFTKGVIGKKTEDEKTQSGPTQPIRNIWLESYAVYETDKDFDFQNLIAQFMVSIQSELPTKFLDFGSTRTFGRKEGDAEDKVYLIYRISQAYGIEAGQSIEDEGTMSVETDGIFRLVGRWNLSLTPNLGKKIGDKLTFQVSNLVRFLEDDDFDAYNLFTTSADWSLSENAKISLKYQSGRDAPKFESKDEFSIGLGVKWQ